MASMPAPAAEGPPEAGGPLFDLRDEHVRAGATEALRGVDLRVERGEQLVVIGPSGAGKTTLLRLLQALRPADCACVHQDYALVPQLSAFHNVYAGRLDRNSTLANLVDLVRPRRRVVEELRPLFRDLGMEEKLFEAVSQLSGGQQQRVAVGRALYQGGSVVLADEPVSAVDPHQAGDVLELLKAGCETAVVAMHDVDLALRHFDRAVGLREGRVAFDLGSTEVGDGRLEALYRGEANPEPST